MKNKMNNYFFKSSSFMLMAIVLLYTACNSSPYPGYELADNGVYAKFYNRSEDSMKVQQGDLLTLIMSYKNAKDSVIFDSKIKNPYGKVSIDFPVGKSPFVGSFEEALMMMSIGDSASFLINADSLYFKAFNYNELPAYIEPGSMLIFEAKVLAITTKEEFEEERRKTQEEELVMLELRKNEEPKTMVNYLLDNKIKTKPTESGLYYVESVKGTGSRPVNGSVVRVDYTASLLDGRVFDTSKEDVAMATGVFDERRKPYTPYEFVLGDAKEIPPGFSEGVSLMKVGAKARLIVPSSLGFGASVNASIPPYSTLLFDVELISITPPNS